MNRIIVGVDPGTSIGLAVLDIEGNIVAVKTIRNGGKTKILEEIRQYGRPYLVCTDVKDIPETVGKVASAFGAKTWHPDYDLSVLEKSELAPNANNYHERDALAAAKKAYNMHANKLRHLIKLDKLDRLEKKKIDRKKPSIKKQRKKESEEIVKLRKEIEKLREKNKTQSERIRELEKRIEDIKEVAHKKAKREIVRRMNTVEDNAKYELFALRREKREIEDKIEEIKRLINTKKTALEVDGKLYKLEIMENRENCKEEVEFGGISIYSIVQGPKEKILNLIQEYKNKRQNSQKRFKPKR